MNDWLTFNNWLKQRRRVLNLTQEELAQRALCSASTIRKIESGDLLPSRELAQLLAVAIDVPPAAQAAFITFARDETATAQPNAFSASVASSAPVLLAPLPPAPRPERLPAQLTSFIARANEVNELCSLLHKPDCNLLTLVGPGGIGKTRLALAVAQSSNLTFPGGVAFVALAGLNDPEFIVSAIADALGFSFAGNVEPKTQLFHYLAEKEMLLVFDNFEHLLEGVGLLVELLQAASRLKLLVTSREHLNVQGEWVFDLPTLSTPPQATSPIAAIEQYGSVALFVDRARRGHKGFVLSEENSVAVAQICRLVGGMPLGIELAASWVHILSCTEIACEIERNLDFLAVTRRDLPERQRSMRASFDHSWKLLSPEEQRVLRRLSVFRGGFQREAAAQVAGAALPLLASLVSKSLIRRTAEGRYDLHELVRQYAADHLSQTPSEERQACYAHADCFLGKLDDHSGLFDRHHTATFLDWIRNSENLRVAWLWAATSGHYDLLRRAASTFWYYHALRLLLHEGEALFSLALQALAGQQLSDQETGALQRVVKGCLQANRGWFRARVGHCAEARLEIEQAIASLRCEQDRAVLADALHHLSVVEWLSASFTKAQEYAHEALALNRALARDWHVALCLTSLGSTFYLAQDFAQSLTYFEEALEIMRRLGEPRSIALAIVTVGATTRALGRLAEAKTLLQEGLIRAAQLDDGWTTALIHQSMGLIADAEDEPEVARQLLERALHFFQERHDAWFSVDTLNALGWLHHKAGRPEDAWQSFADALQLAGKAEAMPGILSALVGLATMQAQTAPDGLQLIIIEHALTHPASTKETKDHAAKLRCELQIAFSPQQVEAAQAQAKSATLAGLVAEILTD